MSATTDTSNAASLPLPSHVSPAVQRALSEAKQRLQSTYGNRLRHVILYGSRARGDARSEGHPSGESDVDILVVLDDDTNRYAEFKRLAELKMDLFERHRLTLSFKPYTEEAYQDLRRPFIQNVHAEGIEL